MKPLSPFDLALNHAPVIGLIDVGSTEQIFRAATACWAGGFRLIAIPTRLESAPDIVCALGARPDLLVGLWDVGSESELEAFEGCPYAFAFGQPSLDSEAVRVHSKPFIPIVRSLENGHGGYQRACISAVDAHGGVAYLSQQMQRSPVCDVFVQGRIGGDECISYIEAGARAVVLTDALMSSSLLESGDYKSIRNYAAAVHQEATRLSRKAQERTA